MSESREPRPFHESIVPFIENAGPANVQFIALLITRTTIPKNHDQIAEAWGRKMADPAISQESHAFGVVAHVESEKRKSREKEEKKQSELNPPNHSIEP